MGSRRYDIGIDLWSVGCIVGEMFRCRPLMPGTSTAVQLEMIFEVTGNPTSVEISSWRSPRAMSMLNDVRAKCRVSLDELCRDRLPRDARGLMKCLLRLDPNMRGTSEVALGHAYLADVRDPVQETAYPRGPIRIGISDGAKLTADEYRRRIYRIIAEESKGPESYTTMHLTSDIMNELPSAVSYDSMDINDNSQG